MDELENMKTLWLELSQKVSALEDENRHLARKVMNEKFKSARERLIKKYNGFIIVESIMIVYVLIFIFFNPLIVEKYRIVTSIYWLLFFLFEIAIDWYLKERVRNIDIYHSSVREISVSAAKNWKLHKIAILIGVPVAIGAAILLALALNANEFTIYGMVIGGLIGAFIGIMQMRNFLEYYRQLQPSKE